MAANIIIIERRLLRSGVHENDACQCPWFRDQPIASNRNASPIRLESIVIIPAPKDFGFW